MRILLVEDDRMIGAAIAQALKDAAYAVDWVTDGQSATDAADVEPYDLILLDLGLPKPDGLDVLRRLRKRRQPLPVIIVTARDGIEDRVDGLDLGADDYLVKPFEMRELLARMRAILRRQGSGSPAILSNGALSLDPATHQANHAGTVSQLTAREFALLHALLSRPGVIFSAGGELLASPQPQPTVNAGGRRALVRPAALPVPAGRTRDRQLAWCRA